MAAASEALSLGRGGISIVARAAGLSRPTIHKGLEELKTPDVPQGRVREPGGGRKSIYERDPEMVAELERLVDPETRAGQSMPPLRWTCKSTRQLSRALGDAGHVVSHPVVAETLHQLGYSLHANAKTRKTSSRHPSREAQFQFVNRQVLAFLGRGLPVISVDTKKKERLRECRNPATKGQPTGEPEQVQVHDFPDLRLDTAMPSALCDVARNLGWVDVGSDHYTAGFAASSIRRWWQDMGIELYPSAGELLICADGGGTKGYRVRLWKGELQKIADALRLTISVSGLPPGTRKWNKIEHRLCSRISMNRRGRPLTSHEVIVDLIGNTTTNKDLDVTSTPNKYQYQTKVDVPDEQLASVGVLRPDFHGDWNYTIQPHRR